MADWAAVLSFVCGYGGENAKKFKICAKLEPFILLVSAPDPVFRYYFIY